MAETVGNENIPQENAISKVTPIDLGAQIYYQIAESDDIAYKLAALMTFSDCYSYALRLANEVNGRQGRNRLTVSIDTVELMKYSLDTDINDVLDRQLTELFVNILNTYLSGLQELPANRPREAQGKVSRVKTLCIMLVATNQYGIIPLLNLPPYILKNVGDLFDNLQKLKESVLEAWIEYLKAHNNFEMAEIVRSVGNDFWGSEGIKANVIYERYFGELDRAGKINEPAETYAAYLKFRADYRRSTKNILPSKIYDIFNFTSDAYNNMRMTVYKEIQALIPEDQDNEVAKRLIFEQ